MSGTAMDALQYQDFSLSTNLGSIAHLVTLLLARWHVAESGGSLF